MTTQNDEEKRPPEMRVEERLVARMARLERTHRRLQWMVRGLMVTTAALLVLAALPVVERQRGAPSAERAVEVRAERFVLLDSGGATRGVWQVAADSAVRLSLRDASDRSRLNLAVLKGGSPGISLSDDGERKRVALGLLPDQTSTLVFADAAGVPRAVLGLSHRQAANLLFADASGIGRVSLALDSSGRGSAMIPGMPDRESDPPLEGDDASGNGDSTP